MDLTRERALRLHREMWSDMQKEFGDCPTYGERRDFKRKWAGERFPKEIVSANCFLCEYAKDKPGCSLCPVNWGRDGEGGNCCEKVISTGVDWRRSPISEILALPEREDV